VVAMIPEHGAAVRGERMQIAGLREIPSPSITLVPVGIKVVGPQSRRTGEAARVGEPTSYLAVAEIVRRMLARSPFGAGGFAAADYAADLPLTHFVAQDGNNLLIENGGRYYLKQEKESWAEYVAGR
jgi:hypothetical protein